MLKAEKVKRVLQELEAIEDLVKPYESYSSEVSVGLKAIATFKESLRDPKKVEFKQVINWAKEAERQAEERAGGYSGQGPVEEIMGHIANIKKATGEP